MVKGPHDLRKIRYKLAVMTGQKEEALCGLGDWLVVHRSDFAWICGNSFSRHYMSWVIHFPCPESTLLWVQLERYVPQTSEDSLQVPQVLFGASGEYQHVV